VLQVFDVEESVFLGKGFSGAGFFVNFIDID